MILHRRLTMRCSERRRAVAVAIGGLALPQLRNALAHGDEIVISRVDGTTFDGVRSLLFDPPARVLPRILSYSMRYPEAS